MSHTPGPWELDFSPDVDLPNHVGISAQDHKVLAQVAWKMDDDERSPQCEANARLIAAPPMLLEALRPIAERGGISAEIIRNAQAAIAEATCAK